LALRAERGSREGELLIELEVSGSLSDHSREPAVAKPPIDRTRFWKKSSPARGLLTQGSLLRDWGDHLPYGLPQLDFSQRGTFGGSASISTIDVVSAQTESGSGATTCSRDSVPRLRSGLRSPPNPSLGSSDGPNHRFFIPPPPGVYLDLRGCVPQSSVPASVNLRESAPAQPRRYALIWDISMYVAYGSSKIQA
jgi:hypothetical protein